MSGQPSLVHLNPFLFLARRSCSSLSLGVDSIVEFTARYGEFVVILGADVVFWLPPPRRVTALAPPRRVTALRSSSASTLEEGLPSQNHDVLVHR